MDDTIDSAEIDSGQGDNISSEVCIAQEPGRDLSILTNPYPEPWFDLSELPDDQFCAECIENHVPDQWVPALKSEAVDFVIEGHQLTQIDPVGGEKSPSIFCFGPKKFVERRFECCFCRLIAHSISPDVSSGHGAVLSVELRENRFDGVVAEVEAFDNLIRKPSRGNCTRIKIADDQSQVSSALEVDYAVIRILLSKCQADEDCLPDSDVTSLKPTIPIRLVDTMQDCVVTKTSAERYVALSYVWGHVDMSALTSKGMSYFTEPHSIGKHMDDVPHTIKDAILFTQNLGERYLWVDVLCIEQDDPDKKAEEIRHMDVVFQGALLTIVALSSSDAQQGLPGVRSSTVLPTMTQMILGSRFESSPKKFDYKLERMTATSKHVTRAWTYQEVLLSPTLIYFGYRDSVFVHGEDSFRVLTDGPDSSNGARIDDRMLRTQLLAAGASHGDDPLNSGMDVFAHLLLRYSDRDATELTDRIHAFAGCLSRLEPAIGPYIQGLPTAAFLQALLWKSSPSTPWDGSYGRNHAFASWSWAGWTARCYLVGKNGVRIDVDTLSVSFKECPEPRLLTSWISSDVSTALFSHRPYLGVTLHFEAVTVSAFSFRARRVHELEKPQWHDFFPYQMALFTVDDKDDGTIHGVGTRHFNEARDDDSGELWDLVLVAETANTDQYGWKADREHYESDERRMGDFLLIRWDDIDTVAERIGSGYISMDAFNAAGPKRKKIVLT